MTPATNFILVAIGFLSVCVGVFTHRHKRVRVVFFSLAALLFLTPFVLQWYFTRDAYEWNVVVVRETADEQNPPSVYLERIEWITDYEVLKRQRGNIRSALLGTDAVRREWRVKGYVPIQIRAEVKYGTQDTTVTRNFRDVEAGSYVFTLHIRDNFVLTWSIDPLGDDSGPR